MIDIFLFRVLNCNCISFSITLDLIGVGIGRPPGLMDPKALLPQPYNKTAHERVKTNYIIMFYYLKINIYINLVIYFAFVSKEQLVA
jgi:hypothetical protein